MDAEAESDKQRRRMITKSSSIKRKPLANLTNIIHKPQSKKPTTSTASNSSIGSTQNPIHLPISTRSGQHVPSEPQRLATDRLVDDENRNLVGRRRQTTQNTKSNTKDAVSFRQRTRNAVKESSASLCSPTLEKTKDQGNVNPSRLDKTKNDGQILYKRKATDVPSSAPHMKNASNSVNTPVPHSTIIKYSRQSKNLKNNADDTPVSRSTVNIKDKGKENIEISADKGKTIDVPLNYRSVKNVKSNMAEAREPLKEVIIKDRGDMDMGSSHVITSNSGINRKDKGKAIAMPDDYPSTTYRKISMMEGHFPLKGIVINDGSETVSGSSHADHVHKDGGKAVATPVSYRTLDKQSSCPPPLRSTSNRNEVVGSEDIVQLKPQTEPPPNKKKRRCSSKEEYTLPKEYVEQQRAYFKEIDDFELLVEEV
ncbi:uncharacterized protein [Rutidosis leptorrhynchoides]|uniref:uncharacterized protein n=1 Tax=Rutidosis leptorrhynchoides TaxID=125765 RepID=UPI003A992382